MSSAQQLCFNATDVKVCISTTPLISNSATAVAAAPAEGAGGLVTQGFFDVISDIIFPPLRQKG